ncbi:MAG: hypothetical protein Q4D66_04370 [Bacteroidales bacterium]|nr:hypothetical protein [Bacteroidales bacterium]
MTLLHALPVHHSPYAPMIIVVFMLGAAALYCVPTLFRLLRHIERPLAENALDDAEDKGYACHDEAFLHAPYRRAQ